MLATAGNRRLAHVYLMDAIRLVCPECDTVHRVKNLTLGKPYRCKQCGAGLITMQPAALVCPACGATRPPAYLEVSHSATCGECAAAPLMEIKIGEIIYRPSDLTAAAEKTPENNAPADRETPENITPPAPPPPEIVAEKPLVAPAEFSRPAPASENSPPKIYAAPPLAPRTPPLADANEAWTQTVANDLAEVKTALTARRLSVLARPVFGWICLAILLLLFGYALAVNSAQEMRLHEADKRFKNFAARSQEDYNGMKDLLGKRIDDLERERAALRAEKAAVENDLRDYYQRLGEAQRKINLLNKAYSLGVDRSGGPD
ncbi:hypothetical protein FACS1894139_02210 [Planctomycetales bacterium]|nr:hypothetical protein FACS1894107_10940 [Planctomycetales bacterium]GHS96431.1 hypothetical protein FACS1894108_01030 [Planctomycetales bacterium]GHT02981.1 hypothetical protein FACS1894139_02210 [Planctomycetales bacterium]